MKNKKFTGEYRRETNEYSECIYVREIDNGFILRYSKCPKGKEGYDDYDKEVCVEVYSKTNPFKNIKVEKSLVDTLEEVYKNNE